MITISAFADEIAPDLKTQMDVCLSHGVRHIDVRGIDNTNVSKFTLAQAKEYRKVLDDRGFGVPCIGSPIGKIRIDEPFAPHLDLLKHCCELAKVFGAEYVRIFSFYPPEGGNILNHRQQVMDQMQAMVKAGEAAGVTMLHENEANIYGERTPQVKELFATIKSPRFKGAFDPANYVHAGLRPLEECWNAGLAELTHYFHIKDMVRGQATCVPAGTGQGQIPEILADAQRRGYSGYMTLEPHMARGGQFSGFTGPDLFGQAATALKNILDKLGMKYQ